ncbi:MAG TPA: hypothetical protein VF367_09105 [Candidatus Limnocylindria bacterium]
MNVARAATPLLVAVALLACNPVRVAVTEVEEAGPLIVFDVTNQSPVLRDVRYEIAEPSGASAGSTSAVQCARTVVELGRASRTIELTIDGEAFGSYTVTPADAQAGWLVMRMRIAPDGGALLLGVAAAENNPQAPLTPVPGCED